MKRTCISNLLLMLLCQTCASEKGIQTVIDRKSDNQEIAIVLNSTFDLHLEGNPTTGYTWGISELDTNIINLTGKGEFIRNNNLDGSGGTFVFRFKGVSIGLCHLKLLYSRAPMNSFSVIDSFHLDIRVQ